MFTYTSIPPTPFLLSLIILMVSVNVKHPVYLLTPPYTPFPPPTSLISLLVSVDFKHHVHVPTPPYTPFFPSLISLMVSVDVKRHVYLLCLSCTLVLFRPRVCGLAFCQNGPQGISDDFFVQLQLHQMSPLASLCCQTAPPRLRLA